MGVRIPDCGEVRGLGFQEKGHNAPLERWLAVRAHLQRRAKCRSRNQCPRSFRTRCEDTSRTLKVAHSLVSGLPNAVRQMLALEFEEVQDTTFQYSLPRAGH